MNPTTPVTSCPWLRNELPMLSFAVAFACAYACPSSADALADASVSAAVESFDPASAAVIVIIVAAVIAVLQNWTFYWFWYSQHTFLFSF